MRVLVQSETLFISDSSLLNYQIQKLLFENSPVNENQDNLVLKKSSNYKSPIIPKFSLSIVKSYYQLLV